MQVARAWHVDVAQFLLDHKANINKADNYGRTPLHVAAAVDYPEMVTFLVEHGGKLYHDRLCYLEAIANLCTDITLTLKN